MMDPIHQIVEAATEQLVGHDPLDSLQSKRSQKIKNSIRIIGMFALAIAAVYGFIEHLTGNTVFALVGIVCLVLTATWDDASAAILTFGGIIVSASIADVYHLIVRTTRNCFRRGDFVVRGIMIILAVGGTAWICKYKIENFNLLPAYLDLVVKRVGPALAIVAVVLYPASLVSKRIFELSAHKFDRVVQRYEFAFYIAVVFFSLTIMLLFAGTGVESSKEMPVHAGTDPLITGPVWSEATSNLLIWISVIWILWVISTGACIISRFLEWSWRDRPSAFREAVLKRTKIIP